jgi:hypothetical protein
MHTSMPRAGEERKYNGGSIVHASIRKAAKPAGLNFEVPVDIISIYLNPGRILAQECWALSLVYISSANSRIPL